MEVITKKINKKCDDCGKLTHNGRVPQKVYPSNKNGWPKEKAVIKRVCIDCSDKYDEARYGKA